MARNEREEDRLTSWGKRRIESMQTRSIPVLPSRMVTGEEANLRMRVYLAVLSEKERSSHAPAAGGR